MIEYEEFIAGEKFIHLADHAYNKLNEYDRSYNIPDYTSPIIIYCHTEFVNRLFQEIKHHPPFVLISHNGDGRVTDSPQNQYDADINQMPPNLLHWFGQNANVKHPNITSIPIGLENSCWFPEINKQLQIYNTKYYPTQYYNLCYMNFSLGTNPVERTAVYNKFKDMWWVGCDMRYNGYDFGHYLSMLQAHTFTICPAGNPNGHNPIDGGTSTHRLWEALYCDRIPIVIKGPQSESFSDLPILQLSSWDELTEDLLSGSINLPYDLSQLKMSYWKNKIKGCINE
jgi:hypothetical protein